jgi:hypothetical protein
MDILSPALSLEESYYASGFALGKADGARAGLIDGRRFGLEKGFEKFANMGRIHGRAIVWGSRLLGEKQQQQQQDRDGASSEIDRLQDEENENEKNRNVFMPVIFDRKYTQPQHGHVHAQRKKEQENQIEMQQKEEEEKEERIANQFQDPTLLSLLPPSPATATTSKSSAKNLPPLPISGNHHHHHHHQRLTKHIQTLYALSEPESLSLENNEEAVSEFDDRYRRAVAKGRIVVRIVKEDDGGGASDGEEFTGFLDAVEDEDAGSGAGIGRKSGKSGEDVGEGEVEEIGLGTLKRMKGSDLGAQRLGGSGSGNGSHGIEREQQQQQMGMEMEMEIEIR